MPTIDWTAGVITIAKAEMALVTASPELRELDLDTLRHELRTLEASVNGMPWTDTHVHATEITISGVTYARFVSILAPYTVEFEDGQYAVRTVGANHNLLDVKLPNQVSVLVQNSAGLVNNPAPAAVADAVWDEATAGHAAAGSFGRSVTDTQIEATRGRQQITNRAEIDFTMQRLIVYADDGVTILYQAALQTNDGSPVTTAPGAQTKRGAPL